VSIVPLGFRFSPRNVLSIPARLTVAGTACFLGGLVGCGYHLAGQADTLPDTIQTIAVTSFRNATTEFKVEQYMTQAVARELLTRTRYHVIADESRADATLSGTVVNVWVAPAVIDRDTGRATRINLLTQVQVSLRERRTGRVIYENPNFEHRDQYEVSTSAGAYFDERQSALMRTSEAVARSLVSAVLEGF
jgi:hypothetical protein